LEKSGDFGRADDDLDAPRGVCRAGAGCESDPSNGAGDLARLVGREGRDGKTSVHPRPRALRLALVGDCVDDEREPALGSEHGQIEQGVAGVEVRAVALVEVLCENDAGVEERRGVGGAVGPAIDKGRGVDVEAFSSRQERRIETG
jgi:hypothetical protein